MRWFNGFVSNEHIAFGHQRSRVSFDQNERLMPGSKLKVSPQGDEADRASVAIVAGILDPLQIERKVHSFAYAQVVIGFQNHLRTIAKLAVAELESQAAGSVTSGAVPRLSSIPPGFRVFSNSARMDSSQTVTSEPVSNMKVYFLPAKQTGTSKTSPSAATLNASIVFPDCVSPVEPAHFTQPLRVTRTNTTLDWARWTSCAEPPCRWTSSWRATEGPLVAFGTKTIQARTPPPSDKADRIRQPSKHYVSLVIRCVALS